VQAARSTREFLSLATLFVTLFTALPAPAASPDPGPAPDPRKAKKTEKAAPESTPAGEIEKAISVFRIETAKLSTASASAASNKSSLNPFAQWHGRVYEYIRNNAFDAVPHEVVQNGGNRNILRRNQYGISVSGPVMIPKLYDGSRKTFFTFSFEGTRERVGRSYLRTLPTTMQRAGDFSDLVNKAGNPVQIYDPSSTSPNAMFDPSEAVTEDNLEFNREPFANNRIPLSRLDPVALAASEFYPLPNTDIGPFLQNNYWSNPSEVNTPDGFIAKLDHQLFERHKVTIDMAHSRGFSGMPRIYPTAGNPGFPDRDFLNRRIQVRENYAVSPSTIFESSFEAESQEVDTLTRASASNLPGQIGLRGVSGDVFPVMRIAGFYGMGAPSGAFLRNVWNNYELENSFSYRSGKHSWRFSNEISRNQLNTRELESPSGEVAFNTALTGLPGINNTGSGYAGFLLGQPYRAEVTDQPQPAYLRRTVIDNTIVDEIEVTPRLTATLGFSVDISTPRIERYDRQSTIDLNAVNPANNLPGALVFASRDGYDRGFQPTRFEFEPRLGVAWSPTEKRDTVIRGNFYLYFTDIPLRAGDFGTQGFSAIRQPLSPNRQLEPAIRLVDGFPELDYPLPLLRGDAVNGADADFIPATRAQPRYIYARLSYERRLPAGITVRADARSYRGKNMLIGGQVLGLNNVPTEALDFRDQLNEEAFRAQLRPFPQFQRISTDGQFPGGRYLYDVGDFSVEKRTGQGLSFDLSYQLRRRWDDYSGPGVQDPLNREFSWARSLGNRPRRFSMSYVYELPFGDGKPLLSRPGVFSKIVGDWSVSGFTTWLAGDPVVFRPEFNNTGGIVPYLRVNSVPGVDPHLANPGPEAWFNASAFAHPEDFTLGNVPRTHPTLNNPSWQNHDLAITKRVPLPSEQTLELLFQSFNFLNTANWNDPDATIGTAAAPNQNAGRIIGSRGGRVLQLGARYNF